MAAVAVLKNQKIAISRQRDGRSDGWTDTRLPQIPHEHSVVLVKALKTTTTFYNIAA